MDKKLSITDLDLKGKRVLIRVDFNVPLDDKGNVSEWRVKCRSSEAANA